MIERAHVIGAGRVGSAIAARLRERGLDVGSDEPELVLLCVPDRAIAEVAAGDSDRPVGRACERSDAARRARAARAPLRLAPAADVHARPRRRAARRRVRRDHRRDGGGLRVADWLARLLGLEPFPLADAKRATYHAGAAIASNYLVTLRRAAGSLLEAAGAPPEALDPLMRRTIENGFELTGPIARGDWETVDAHVAAIRRERPELEQLYATLAETTKALAVRTLRTISEARQDLQASRRGRIGLVPTMGALHAGHEALIAAARAECDTVVVSLFVNAAQFDEDTDLLAYPRDEDRDAAIAEAAGADVLFAPAATEMYPPGFQTWVEVEELSRGLEGEHRPGHFRAVATVCLKLFNIVRPQFAYFGQKDAQQVAVVRRMVRDLNLDLTVRSIATVRDADGLALSSRNARLSVEERALALALPRALATRDPDAARALLDGLDVDYVEVADFDPPVLAAAVRVGSTRLIDNVVLTEEEP